MNNELPKLNRASWLRNFGRSVKYAVVESFNEHFPMAEAYKNQSPNDDLNFARKELRTRRKFFSFVSKNTGLDTFFNDVDLAYKNMKTSMKSGNFYNSRRARKAERGMFEAFGVDNSELDELENFLKSDFNDDSEESLDNEGHSGDLSSLEKDLEQGFNDNSQIISETVTGSADYIAGSIKGAANIAYSTSLQTIRELKFGFGNLNSGIAAINQFNKDQMTAHIANTTKYFETTTDLLQQQNVMLKGLLEIQTNLYEAARKQSGNNRIDDNFYSIVDRSTGLIDFSKYLSNVKSNIMDRSVFGMYSQMFNISKQEIIQNPMQFMLKQALSAIGGSKVEQALEDLQKNLIGSLETLNAKITRGGMGGSLNPILSLLGIHENVKTIADTKFEKGPMQFNGAANKSIVEVIPTYLARIEAAITGGPLRLFDMNRGTWTTSKEIRERWDKESIDSSQSVQNIIKDKASKTVRNIGTFTPEQKEAFKSILSDVVIPTLKNGTGVVDKKVFDNNGKLTNEFLKSVGLADKVGLYDPTMVELVGKMFANMKDSDRKSLVTAARSDRLAKSNMIASISGTDDINSILVNGALNGLPDSQYHLSRNSLVKLNEVNKNLVGNSLLSQSGGAAVDVLKEIYKEVFGIHSLMLTSKGGKNRNILSTRKIIDFDEVFALQAKSRMDQMTIQSQKSTGIGDVFGSGEVDTDALNTERLQEIIAKIKSASTLDDAIGRFNENINELCFALVESGIPHDYDTGNISFNEFLKSLIIYGSDNIPIWIMNNKALVRNAISALRYKPTNTKAYDPNSKDVEKIISDNLQKDEFEEEDSYNKYKGNNFFEKLSNANGFLEKFGVIASKAKNLVSSPMNFMTNAINNFSSIMGDIISGNIGSAGSTLTSLIGGNKAFGGNIPGPWPKLYALSPGEKVIPAYLNPDNPNRKNANPLMDAIRENIVLARAREAGLSPSGGFFGGVASVDDSKPPGMIDAAKALLSNITDIGSDKFRKSMDDFLSKYIEDKELKDAAKEALNNKDADALKVALTGITAKDIVNKSKEISRTIWGRLGDAANVIIKYIPDSIKENIKNISEYSKGGAALGAISGLVGGPFGLIGGTLLGTAVGAVHHSEEAQNMLFGPGIGNSLRKFFGGKQGTTYAAVGATVGGLVGGPFGAVGGLILGSGLNMVKNSEKFNDYLFGPKGLIAKMDYFFGETFANTRKDFVKYIQDAITKPIENAMIPIGTALQVGFRKTFELVDKGIRNVIKPKIFDLSKFILGKSKENKYIAGALGGAAGGALIGGPMGAVLGGIVGSVAHGTGFDKQFIKLGKVPGRMLNSLSNKLATWEISSGNGFNWTAEERIAKMKDIYKNQDHKYFQSDQYKTDLKMSQSNREELIKVQMMVDVARGIDPKIEDALNEAKVLIQNACITNGVSSTTTNKVLETITNLKGKATLQDALDVINKSKDNIPPDKQKNLESPNGLLDTAINNYVSLHDFIANYIDNEKSKENAIDTLKKDWNINSENEADLKKVSKNISRDLNSKPLEKKADTVYTAVSAVVEYGEKIANTLDSWFNKLFNTTKSLGYVFSHTDEYVSIANDGTIESIKKKGVNNTVVTTTYSPNGGRVVRTEKLNDNGAVLWATEEFYNKDGQKVDPNMVDDKRDKESVQEQKDKDDAKALAEKSAESQERQAEATETLVNQNKGLLGFFKNMGKSSNGIMKGLKDVFSFITSPIRSLFGAFDSFMDSIPIIGDAWNYGKMKLRTGAKALGAKAMGYLNKKIFGPAKSKGIGWINRQRRGIGNVIQNDKNYAKTRNILDYLQGKQVPLSDADAQILINQASGIELTPDEKKRFNELRRYNRNAGSFARNMEAWRLNTNRKYRASNIESSIRSKWQGLAGNLSGNNMQTILSGKDKQLMDLYMSGGEQILSPAQRKRVTEILKSQNMVGSPNKLADYTRRIFGNKRATQLGNLMGSEKNLERITTWGKRIGTVGSKATKVGTAVASKVGKFAGKWGGKLLGGVLDVIDSMAIYNTMKEAEQSVEIPDENPEAALPVMAKMLAGISASIPLIGEAIKRGPVDGIGDLVGSVVGEAGTIGKLAKGAKGKGAKGLLAAGKGLLKGKGLKGAAVGAIALGAGYLGVKTGLITPATAVSSAETAANTSRVSSFFTAAYKSICKVASKFLSPEKAKLLSGLGSKLLKTITTPAVFGKIGSKMLRRIAGVIAGPAGWAVLGVFAAKAFYDGFSDANNIWKPKQGEEMTITKKAICGLAYAIADFCCLDLVMPIEQIVGMIKSMLGFTSEELETGGSFVSSIFDGNIPTIFNLKDKMKNLSNDIFNINITGKLNDMMQPFKDFAKNLWNKLGEKINQAWESVKEFAEKAAEWWKNFSIKDAISGAITKGKEWLDNLFNFNVGEKSKKLIEEDSNSLEVHQLDEDDEAAVAKARASISPSVFDDIFGTKAAKANRSSGRKHIGSLTARDMSGDYKSKWNIPGSGDGGFFKFFRWGKGDGGNGDDLPVQIWRYLESKNIGSSAIAGIMGNIQAESGFMPNRVQGAGVQTAPEITVDGQTGYGLCQWTYPTRQQALKDFAASRNKSSSDLETQLDFMLQEINQRDSGLLGRMAKMEPYDAAIHFHDEYEGSADDASMKARRGDYAKEIFQNQGRGIKTPGAYAASGGGSTSGGGGGSMSNSSGGGIFSEIGKLFENSALGKLGKELFGDAGFFTSGLFGGGSSSSNGGKYGGGAGSSRSTPRGKGKPDDRGILTEEPEEGQYWVRQTGGVTLKGCHVQALEVLDCLGKFFYDHTGHKLVVTAGTNGKHAEGNYSHASGWKLDVNDWYGPENLQGGWITEGASFTSTFKKFGHDNGLGMADEGDHIDIQFADGYDWQDGQYYGGWDAVHGKKANTSMSVADFLTTSLNGAITGKYGESRDNGNHGGIDIGANLGIPIKSPIDGQVTKIAYEPGGYGNYLQIRDSKGKYHLFAHLNETPKLELGNKITAGQEIAKVGSSGLSSGPHLHYQIDPESNKEGLKKGPHIDPNSYELDPKVRSFIEEQNSVADFRKLDEQMNKGDGGFLDPLKDAIVANKAENYNDKLDVLINILGSILEVIKFAAGNMNSNNTTTNEGSGSLATAIPALAGATMPKMNTTTPGKSIQSIVANMLKIAMDNT